MTAICLHGRHGHHHSLGTFLAELCVEARDGLDGEARSGALARMSAADLAPADAEPAQAALTDNFR